MKLSLLPSRPARVFIGALLIGALAGCSGKTVNPEQNLQAATGALNQLAQPMEFYLSEHLPHYPDKLEDLLKAGHSGKPYLEKLPVLPPGVQFDYQVNNQALVPTYTLACKGLEGAPEGFPRLTSKVEVELTPAPGVVAVPQTPGSASPQTPTPTGTAGK